MNKAIYAFSGDPITYGHVNIIERAAKSFDQVTVAIGVNPDKKYMFSLAERTEMAEKTLKEMPKVDVVSFKGMLVDYAFEQGIGTIVKGVRNAADFDYETILHQVGESQKLGIDTHIMLAKPELAHISSSVTKAVLKEQGQIQDYVPLHVKQALEARMLNQYIVGITGEIGSGKSYVSDRFVTLGERRGIDVHNIDLDRVGHQILRSLDAPAYDAVRQTIADEFGAHTRLSNGIIDRKALGEKVFNDPEALKTLNEIMEVPILLRMRKEMQGKEGLILVNAALIAEANMSYVSNNNTVLLDVEKAEQEKRLAQRKLDPHQIQRRLKSQFDFNEKRENLRTAIETTGHGKIWVILNDSGNDNIDDVFSQVVEDLKVV